MNSPGVYDCSAQAAAAGGGGGGGGCAPGGRGGQAVWVDDRGETFLFGGVGVRRGSERLYSAERAGIGTAGGVCGRHTCVHGGWLAADRPGPWQVVVAADVGYLSDMWRLPLHQNRSSFVTVSHSICSGARKPLPLACRRPFRRRSPPFPGLPPFSAAGCCPFTACR